MAQKMVVGRKNENSSTAAPKMDANFKKSGEAWIAKSFRRSNHKMTPEKI